MNILRMAVVVWLLFMLTLSHIPGGPSGEESRWLSSMTGVKESVLRRWAHVVLYFILGCLATIAWAETELWKRCLALIIIAVIDEATKVWVPGRHCSVFPDMIVNLLGAAAGLILGVVK